MPLTTTVVNSHQPTSGAFDAEKQLAHNLIRTHKYILVLGTG